MSGLMSYHAGLSAEAQVERRYVDDGYVVRDRRWRGQAGEIDLIMAADDQLVFIEVKKSRDLARAAERLNTRQMARIYRAAGEYLGQLQAGQDSNARFDVALVGGGGQIEIIENAFGG